MVSIMDFPFSAHALNHLFAQNSWALLRLQPYAGKTIRLQLAPLTLNWVIQPDGYLQQAAPNAPADLCCRVSPLLMPALLLHDQQAFDRMDILGDDALAQEFRLILRNLQWDAAEDLSRFTGDVLAERVVATSAGLASHLPPHPEFHFASPRLPGLPPVLVSCNELALHSSELQQLAQQLAVLEQRVQRLSAES